MPAAPNNDSSVASAMLYLAFDLGEQSWTLAFTTGLRQEPRLIQIPAGNLDRLERAIQLAKRGFEVPADAPIASCYEAGRDGFWLHRWLEAHQVSNVVIDSASIEVNRRQRRQKTDKIDVGKLLKLLLRFYLGEQKVFSVVVVPSTQEEDQRHMHRELGYSRPTRRGSSTALKVCWPDWESTSSPTRSSRNV